MGDTNLYQPLTQTDKVTVVLYRTGIALSAAIIGFAGFLSFRILTAIGPLPFPVTDALLIVMLFSLYFSIGLSVFFIHLYIGKLYRFLRKIYYLSAACLAALLFLGSGNPISPLFASPPYAAFLLIPVVFCLGFIAAKEAFCFRLLEGYLLFGLMPAYVFFYGAGALPQKTALWGLVAIAVMFVFFTLRKIFMPLHYDIGDKSAYMP